MADQRRRQKHIDGDGLQDPSDLSFSSPYNQNNVRSMSGSGAKRSPTDGQIGFVGAVKVVLLLASVGVVFVLAFRPDAFSDIVKNLSLSRQITPVDGRHEEKASANGMKLFTKEELAQHTGEDESKPVLLAYMGKVYDVSKGRRHYGPGGSYSFFSGKDATRSFLTGDFKNDLTDSLDGISDSLYGQIESWEDTYSKSKDYKQVGVLCGEFYQCAAEPHPGQPTEKLLHTQKMIAKAKADEAKENEIYKEFPQCNSEWSQDKGGRIWCSPKSGGIERGWTGFPRLLLTQKSGGSKSTRCACVHPDKLKDPRLELYPNCHPEAESCKMQS